MAQPARKTAGKTARPSPITGFALPVGAHPGNTGGKKGRSGRKPEPFTRFLAKLRQNPKLHRALEQAVSDPDSRGFSSALKVLTDYDDQKPAQKIEVTEPLSTAERQRRIADLLARAVK